MPEGVYFGRKDGRRIADTVRAFETGGSALWLPGRSLYDRDYVRVPFRNNSGETVPAHGCMRITGTETSDGVERFIIAKPNTSFKRIYLINGPDTVASTAQGWATFCWHADWVLYDDASTPAAEESWGPQDGSWEIKKWRYGFTIQGSATGGSTDLVLAQQEWVNAFLCKSNEAIAANGGTGAVSVYDGNQADMTGIDVSSCVNRTGLNYDNGKWGNAKWLGGKWFVEPWECPA